MKKTTLAGSLAAGLAVMASMAVAQPTLDGDRTAGDAYRTALNAAAGIDTNVNAGFGTSAKVEGINVTASATDLFIFVEGSFHSGNRLFVLIDSDNSTATGVVDPGPEGSFGEADALAFFNQLPGGGGYDTVVAVEGTGGDPGNGLGLAILGYNAAGIVAEEKYFGNGGTSITFLPDNNNPVGTFRGANATATVAYTPGDAAAKGIEIRIPRSFLLSSPTDGQVKVAAIGGNGGNNFWSDSAIPQLAAGGNIGFTNGADQARFSGTAPIFDVPNAYTGAGTYIVGTGGDYGTLGAFVDDATGARELSGTLAFAAAGTTITGTGTAFLTEVQSGDVVMLSTGTFRGTAQYLTVTAVASDTSLTVATGPTAVSNVTQKAVRIRTPALFPRALTGNVTASISSNLTEPVNISLAVNTGANSLTFKPRAGTTPTVTFTRNIDNDGFSGDFVIGTISVGANAVVTSTDNIIFDGSNTVAGTTRDLTWTSSNTHSSAATMNVSGDADNVVIRNMRIINNGTSTGGNVSAIRVAQGAFVAGPTTWNLSNAAFAGPGSYTPDNLTIQNNELSVIGGGQGAGVNFTSIGTLLSPNLAATGFLITNNDISARIRGVFMSPAGSGTISNNRIAVGLGGSTSGLGTFGVFNNTSNGFIATQNITGNAITVTTDAASTGIGPTGMFLSSYGAGSVISVRNNTIKTVNNAATPTRVTLNRGIMVSSGVTYNVQHNTVDMSYVNALPAGFTTPAFTYGIGNFLGAANITVQNNIVNNRIPGGGAYWRPNAPTGTFVVNDNLLNAVSGSIASNQRSVAGTATTSTRASAGITRTIFTGAILHGLTIGQTVTILQASTAANAAAYEGTFTVTSVPTTTSFTYDAATPLTEAPTVSAPTIAAPAVAPVAMTTLAEWQASALTPDLVSTAGDPAGSLSLTNLHLINTVAAGLVAAAQVAGLTTDIDGATRAATPNRGADEFAANTPPTAILGSPVVSIAENATGAVVNTVSGADANTLDFPVITATSTAGAVTVSQISSRSYRIDLSTAVDFEANPTFTVNVTATDMAGATTTQAYPIAVTNVNEAPTDITATGTVAEDAAIAAVAATLSTTDVDAGQTFTYALAVGAGDTDNGLVTIVGSSVQVNGALDHETNPTLEIRVTSTDNGTPTPLSFTEALVITVTNVIENAFPSDITLTPSTVLDTAVVTTVIGALTTTDSDNPAANQTHIYTLVVGAGDGDNALVAVNGSNLEVAGVLNATTNPTLEIRVRTTDNGESLLFFEEALVVTVTTPSSVNEWMILNDK